MPLGANMRGGSGQSFGSGSRRGVLSGRGEGGKRPIRRRGPDRGGSHPPRGTSNLGGVIDRPDAPHLTSPHLTSPRSGVLLDDVRRRILASFRPDTSSHAPGRSRFGDEGRGEWSRRGLSSGPWVRLARAGRAPGPGVPTSTRLGSSHAAGPDSPRSGRAEAGRRRGWLRFGGLARPEARPSRLPRPLGSFRRLLTSPLDDRPRGRGAGRWSPSVA